MGVCPVSSRMRQLIMPSLAFTKRVPSSASAAESATNQRKDVKMRIGPFKFIACLSWGSYPLKKCPVAWLLCWVHQGKRHQSGCKVPVLVFCIRVSQIVIKKLFICCLGLFSSYCTELHEQGDVDSPGIV